MLARGRLAKTQNAGKVADRAQKKSNTIHIRLMCLWALLEKHLYVSERVRLSALASEAIPTHPKPK